MNIIKALREEGRREYALLKEKEKDLIAKLIEIRKEMHQLEDHAAIEGVNLLDMEQME
jgi:hypothetical protein